MERLELKLYMAQRFSAVLLAGFVTVHLAMIIYAGKAGLDAAAIVSHTKGSPMWSGFYGSFVLTAGVHGAIGLRNIILETTGFRQNAVNGIAIATGLAICILGLQAVRAVT